VENEWAYNFRTDVMINGDRDAKLTNAIIDRVIKRGEDLGKISVMLDITLDQLDEFGCSSKEEFIERFRNPDELDALNDFLGNLYNDLYLIQELADGED
jgi:hypothetical protein